MCLEDSIKELTIAIGDLIVAIKTMPFSDVKEALSDAQLIVPVSDLVQNATREVEEAKIGTAPNVQAESSTEKSSEASAPTGESSSPAVTYDDVKKITIKVADKNRPKVEAALSRFGVTSAKGLKEEQWADYVAYMKRVDGGEIDPEASHE